MFSRWQAKDNALLNNVRDKTIIYTSTWRIDFSIE